MDTIPVTLNGAEVHGSAGMTILELAQKQGIYIPTLCHDPHLKPVGACRVCLVEDEKSGFLLASCVTPIAPGMKINTESEKVLDARRTVVELLLAGHPDSCIICDKGNACQLRKIASELGIGNIEFDRVRRFYPIETTNPLIERDLSKCIMCGKCIRGCQEIEAIGAIDYAHRGFRTKPAAALDLPLEQSNCEFCGLCVYLCPVGALTDKMSRYRGEAKERVRTVCPYCGVGCSMFLNVRDNEVISVSPAEEGSVNGISLCVKGRYGYDFINSPERLRTPLIKKNGVFTESTWEEALRVIAERFMSIKENYGSDALGGLGSYRCSNEDNYLLQKFFRTALRSNNIDHSDSVNVLPFLNGLKESFGTGATTNSLEEIELSDVILVIGADITESHPIIGQKVKHAVMENDAQVIIVDPEDIKLDRFADMHLKNRAGTEIALINSLIHVIINEGLYNKEFVDTKTEGFENIKDHISKYSPEYVKGITGVSAEDIRQAAHFYSRAKQASIIAGQGLTQKGYGKEIAICLANLALLTANVGKEGCGICFTVPHNNLQGACDMGVLPDNLSGYQSLSDPDVREKFERAWNIKVPDAPGLSTEKMLRAAREGTIRGMYIAGNNIALSSFDKNYTMEALKSLDFLVVQDIFMNETAEMAHVVLPAASFAEKEGTFTNTDRRIQRIRKAIGHLGQARSDWEIIAELSTMIGYPMHYESPGQIMEEIATLVPLYGGISYDRLEKGGLQWPCPHKEHPGTKFLFQDGFDHGKGRLIPIVYNASAGSSVKGDPAALSAKARLYDSGTGTMTRMSLGLSCLMHISDEIKAGA